MSEFLFAYGTLQPGLAPDAIAPLVEKLQVVGAGSVAGLLYDLGSYPGAVVDPVSSRRIRGTVLRLPEDPAILRELDAYEEYDPQSMENSQFIRRLRPVQLTGGETLACWIYEYNRATRGARTIESGLYGC